LLHQVLEKQFIVGRTRLETLDLIGMIVNLTDQQMNDLVQIIHQKECIRTDTIPLLLSRTKLKEQYSEIGQSITKAFNFFFELSTSFSCSLCEQSNEKHFAMNEDQKAFNMEVNQNICNNVFLEGFQNGSLKIFKKLKYLNVFVEMLGCLTNDDISLTPILFKNDYSKMREKGIFCSTNNNWIENQECNEMCLKYSVINRNIFSDVMESISKSKKYFSDLVHEYIDTVNEMVQSKGTPLLTKISLDQESIKRLANEDIQKEKIPLINKFKYFVEAVGGEKKNDEVMKIEIVPTKGIDPSKWEMQLVQESINKLFTFVSLFFVVFFFKD
jgi:hypothetical protein